jgi:hypothetical protein
MKNTSIFKILLSAFIVWLGLFNSVVNANTLSFNNDGLGYSSSFNNFVNTSFNDHWDFYTEKNGSGQVNFGSTSVLFDSYKLIDLDDNKTIEQGGSGYSSSFNFLINGQHHYQLDIFGKGDGFYDGKVCYTPRSPVPEPHTYSMLLVGLGLIVFSSRRRKQPESTKFN